MSTTPPENTAKKKPRIVETDSTTVYEEFSKQASIHKALDFSNIGMPITTPGGSKSGEEKHLRQFHQTRIFVEDYSGMLHHTKNMASATYLISANLPGKLSYNLTSKWSAPLSWAGGTYFNALMQFGTSLAADLNLIDKAKVASGVHRATSYLLWNGTEPLQIQFTIPVIDDNYGTKTTSDISTNLVEALEFLSCLCLPSNATTGAEFYTPPPSPLQATLRWNEKKLNLRTNYARIMVQFGGILLIDNCIIKDIRVSYPNTKTLIKHNYPESIAPGNRGMSYLTPLLAEVSITISTIEAMTSNFYSKMLWLKPQPEMGSTDLNAAKLFGMDKDYMTPKVKD